MSTFPTLSIKPSVEAWEEGVAKDPTIKTDFENGFVQTFPAFSRIPDKWKIGYKAAPQSDKNTLRSFEKSVRVGSNAFSWVNPIDNITYTVRLEGPVNYKPHSIISYWDMNFTLIEV